MKKITFITFIVFIFISCVDQSTKDESLKYITDDLYKKIDISKPPNRIITLAPNLTELVFELGFGDKIVGNTAYCNYPEEAKKIEKVADLLSINTERILSLKPDLIFITVEGNSKSDYQKLLDLGMNVFVSNPRNYNGIKKTLKDMSVILGVEKKADSIIIDWDSRINKVKATHENIVLNTAMFLVSTSPIFTVGKNSFVHEILTFAGLKNLAADSDIAYPMFNREEILIRNPDYIIMYRTNRNDVNELLKLYPEWQTLSAIINDRILYIDADLYSRPGPRFVKAVENLNKLVLSHF